MSQDAAYAEIERRVRMFKSLSAAQRRSYGEDNTRKDFILPLFRALEWDIHNSAEVSAEERVSRGWVDFAFRISGIPRFFLETKRIREDLDDPRWVKQAIDYAWTKSVTWALLSDFEGLRVFNAEWKEDNPLRAQFIEFSVDTYLPDFERLWWLSKPEMARGTLDREAEKVGKKALKEPVSQQLFDDLKEWRRELFRHLHAYNKRYSPAQIDEAVLRILNRLIFVRAAEDREVEARRLLPLLRELDDRRRIGHLPAELAKLFREFDAVYDSDLFAEHFSEKLDCEPEPFRVLIEGLHEKRGGYVRYNFNAIDADVLGTVYEQYLGHVIADPRAAEVVEKRKKRKAQGIYYTPTFVVKYIVQQTLGRYLSEHGYNPARPARVLDMACGSGSFLIEAFDVLDRYLARGRGQPRGNREDVIDYARRMEILSKNIYGVDKDEQAVAVARLNLLLKALHVRDKLPLLHNIRVGDSLISGTPDELRAAFEKDWRAKKPFNWEAEFQEVMKDAGFDVIVGNPPYVRIQTLPKDEVAFFNDRYAAATGNYDIYVLFVERALQLLRPGGVMGFILPNKFFNTSYGIGLRKLITDAKALWKVVDFGDAQVFGGATTYTSLVFLQKRPDMDVLYVPARDWLKEQITSPKAMPDNLAQYVVAAESLSEATWSFTVGKDSELFRKLSSMPIKLKDVADRIFQGIIPGADKVYNVKLLPSDRKKAGYFSRALNTTVHLEPALLRKLVSGAEVERFILKETDSRVIYPYAVQGDECALIVPAVLKRDFPLTYEYFQSTRGLLNKRDNGSAKGPEWYRYIRTQNIALQPRPKLAVPRLVSRLRAGYDLDGSFCLDNVDVGGIIISESRGLPYLYLLGLLNSKLLNFYFVRNSVPFRGGFFSANRQYIENLPIRTVNFDDPADKRRHDAIVARVEEMLQLQKDYAEAERNLEDRRHALKRRIDEVDAALDRIVYELYALTEEEIAVVEGRS